MKKCKSKGISSFFKHRKALMRKRRKLIIKSKKHGLTRREKFKEQLVDIETELLKATTMKDYMSKTRLWTAYDFSHFFAY